MTRNHFLKTLTVLIIAVSAGMSCPQALAQVSFSDNFVDATLRVDYCFSGDAGGQSLSLDCLESSDGWYGRRVNLDRMPLRGNGEFLMKDAETGARLYVWSFSSLFNEWLTYNRQNQS